MMWMTSWYRSLLAKALCQSSCACCIELRDYIQDVEATIAAKNLEFRMQSLTAWQDIVGPPALPPALQESGDLVIAQEQASAAKFHEIQVKLRQDCEAMTRYHSEKLKVANSEHVQRVLHQKSQIAQGACPVASPFVGCSTVLKQPGRGT